MEVGSREWNELGVAGTIYEEEDDEDSCSSIQSLEEFASSPSPNPQFSRIHNWNYLSMARRHDFPPDVVIHVQHSSFGLHKEALMARSTFFKRQLSEFPEITLSPPLNITAETFSLVTDFCYGNHIVITPLNVAALRTAAELLGMTEISESGNENLLQRTEAYFCCVIVGSEEYTSIVLKSCFELLPEAETAASLVSRCIAALSLTAEADGDLRWLDEVKRLGIGDLHLILEAVSRRLTNCHDLLYRIVDAYLKPNIGTVSDDQKIKMCHYIDCSILSPKFLMHAVQNPRMPLRFVVQAMFVEQLNTRASIITAADNHQKKQDHHRKTLTLGAILQRDAAFRQVSELKTIMTATNTRIQTLERELTIMRSLLKETDSTKNRLDSTRSASFRFGSDTNKIHRGQTGSISSLSYRDAAKKVVGHVSSPSSGGNNPTVEKNLGQMLMNGIKSMFRLQRKKCDQIEAISKIEEINAKKSEYEDKNKDDSIIVIKKDDVACHRRSRSHS